jgi:hypothetical protein
MISRAALAPQYDSFLEFVFSVSLCLCGFDEVTP